MLFMRKPDSMQVSMTSSLKIRTLNFFYSRDNIVLKSGTLYLQNHFLSILSMNIVPSLQTVL